MNNDKSYGFAYDEYMKRSSLLVTLLSVIAAVSIAGVVYGVYWARIVDKKGTVERQSLEATIAENNRTISSLEAELKAVTDEKSSKETSLTATEAERAELEKNTKELEETVARYKKLTELDPQLLQKYSKVYFLNEHYVPSGLVSIDAPFVQGKGRTLQFHATAWSFLKKLLEAAEEDHLELRIASAYRSFGTQASLKAAYKVTYGTTAANRFSADQGYSEHQLGTTVDVTTARTGDLSASFETTPESLWLKEHAHEYGFVLSYPKNNKYYIYEPWHWRFVGTTLATFLSEEHKYLYDLDQRDIDAYLLTMFD